MNKYNLVADNNFNLITDKWVPVAGHQLASLADIYSGNDYIITGTPNSKIAVLKLLFAISQAAIKPQTAEDLTLTKEKLCQLSADYLQRWHDAFYLYGEKPFLQMPAAANAKAKSYAYLMPWVPVGNNSVMLFTSDIYHELTDAEKALYLIMHLNFHRAGYADNDLVLTEGYPLKRKKQGGRYSGRKSLGSGYSGSLHSIITGETLADTIAVNLIPASELSLTEAKQTGVPAWEYMPAGEDCERARQFKASLFGLLTPLTEYCFLGKEYFHFTDGIIYGQQDLSATKIIKKPDDFYMLRVNDDNPPWVFLPKILGSFDPKGNSFCTGVKLAINHAIIRGGDYNLYCGGCSVKINCGRQYSSGKNGDQQYQIKINPAAIKENYAMLAEEFDDINRIKESLYSAVKNYFKSFGDNGAAIKAQRACSQFYSDCDDLFREVFLLINFTDNTGNRDKLYEINRKIHSLMLDVYLQITDKGSARQIAGSAKYMPVKWEILKPPVNKINFAENNS